MVTNLILGGHSFIRQLGTDPMPDRALAADIVAACLDSGIVRFDTTYAPERVALGRALADLGRRDEASIMAWNFFEHFGPDDQVGAHEPFRPEHLQIVLDELQTEWIDVLVVHPVDDPAEQARQEELSRAWQAEGRVRRLGSWMADPATLGEQYSTVGAPHNVTFQDFAPHFAAARERGWETFATSPFVRGWELDRRVAESGRTPAELADTMLRFAAFAPNVDFLVVAMRKVEWVAANVASWSRGPLEEAM